MSRFLPPFCPLAGCPSHRGRPFLWIRRGTYPRKCDGRRAQRFFCKTCRRSFSALHFRLDHRLHKPELSRRLFPLFVSKVTHRQAARILGIDRKTVAHRLRLLGTHCRDFHQLLLAHSPGLTGSFLLDELETFEEDRRLKPLTVPVLLQRHTWFVVHVAVGTLPARGHLRPRDQERKEALEAREGRRTTESSQVVRECFAALARRLRAGTGVTLATDKKKTYPNLAREALGERLVAHLRIPGRAPRVPRSPLFPINVTLAMLRDGVSRLVRRSWGASKRRARLRDHLWIWVAYRNYVRVRRVDRGGEPPAGVHAGVIPRGLQVAELLRWKVGFLAHCLQ